MKPLVAILFIVLPASFALSQTAPPRETPPDFKSDNCTWFPDGNYADCCVEHDKEYYFGGSLKERKEADRRLKACVRSKGKGWKRKFLANAMYLGVRIGGVHWLPTPFRWGFGNKWPRKEPEKTKVEKGPPTKPKTDH